MYLSLRERFLGSHEVDTHDVSPAPLSPPPACGRALFQSAIEEESQAASLAPRFFEPIPLSVVIAYSYRRYALAKGTAVPVGLTEQQRCQRCWKVFSAADPSSAACYRCEYAICSQCRVVSPDATWVCVSCAQPMSMLRYCESTKGGRELVRHLLQFCDGKSERHLKTLFPFAALFIRSPLLQSRPLQVRAAETPSPSSAATTRGTVDLIEAHLQRMRELSPAPSSFVPSTAVASDKRRSPLSPHDAVVKAAGTAPAPLGPLEPNTAEQTVKKVDWSRFEYYQREFDKLSSEDFRLSESTFRSSAAILDTSMAADDGAEQRGSVGVAPPPAVVEERCESPAPRFPHFSDFIEDQELAHHMVHLTEIHHSAKDTKKFIASAPSTLTREAASFERLAATSPSLGLVGAVSLSPTESLPMELLGESGESLKPSASPSASRLRTANERTKTISPSLTPSRHTSPSQRGATVAAGARPRLPREEAKAGAPAAATEAPSSTHQAPPQERPAATPSSTALTRSDSVYYAFERLQTSHHTHESLKVSQPIVLIRGPKRTPAAAATAPGRNTRTKSAAAAVSQAFQRTPSYHFTRTASKTRANKAPAPRVHARSGVSRVVPSTTVPAAGRGTAAGSSKAMGAEPSSTTTPRSSGYGQVRPVRQAKAASAVAAVPSTGAQPAETPRGRTKAAVALSSITAAPDVLTRQPSNFTGFSRIASLTAAPLRRLDTAVPSMTAASDAPLSARVRSEDSAARQQVAGTAYTRLASTHYQPPALAVPPEVSSEFVRTASKPHITPPTPHTATPLQRQNTLVHRVAADPNSDVFSRIPTTKSFERLVSLHGHHNRAGREESPSSAFQRTHSASGRRKPTSPSPQAASPAGSVRSASHVARYSPSLTAQTPVSTPRVSPRTAAATSSTASPKPRLSGVPSESPKTPQPRDSRLTGTSTRSGFTPSPSPQAHPPRRTSPQPNPSAASVSMSPAARDPIVTPREASEKPSRKKVSFAAGATPVKPERNAGERADAAPETTSLRSALRKDVSAPVSALHVSAAAPRVTKKASTTTTSRASYLGNRPAPMAASPSLSPRARTAVTSSSLHGFQSPSPQKPIASSAATSASNPYLGKRRPKFFA